MFLEQDRNVKIFSEFWKVCVFLLEVLGVFLISGNNIIDPAVFISISFDQVIFISHHRVLLYRFASQIYWFIIHKPRLTTSNQQETGFAIIWK